MRQIFDSPLARWAFLPPGVIALTYGQYLAALFCVVVTIYAWKVHHR